MGDNGATNGDAAGPTSTDQGTAEPTTIVGPTRHTHSDHGMGAPHRQTQTPDDGADEASQHAPLPSMDAVPLIRQASSDVATARDHDLATGALLALTSSSACAW